MKSACGMMTVPIRINRTPRQAPDGRVGTCSLDRDRAERSSNRHARFNYACRGCQSVALDFSGERGLELCHDLARRADVFIENDAAGVVERAGLDWPALGRHNGRVPRGVRGLSVDEYQALIGRQVIGDVYLEDATT